MRFPTILLYYGSAKICLKDWKRFLLAWVFNVFPLINLITIGYVIESMRVYSDHPEHDRLPAWGSIWGLFVLGVKTSIVCIAWLLPVFLIILIGALFANLMFIMMIISFIVGGFTYYIIPSILIHESQGFGKSFAKDTVGFALTLPYLKNMILVTVVNVPFAMLGQVIPLTLAFTITLLLLCSSRGFAKAHIEYHK